MNPPAWNALMTSPLKSRSPMYPSRALLVGSCMQWMHTDLPGIMRR